MTEKLLPEPVLRLVRVFCGCGVPEDSWQWLLDYLTYQDHPSRGPSDRRRLSAAEEIVVYFLTDLGLLEHGGSIYGSWLTDQGREVLGFLRENGADFLDTGDWVDADQVHYGYSGE